MENSFYHSSLFECKQANLWTCGSHLPTSVVLSSTFLQFSWQLLIVYLSPKTEQRWYMEVLEYLIDLSELVHCWSPVVQFTV